MFTRLLLAEVVEDFKKLYPDIKMKSFLGVTKTQYNKNKKYYFVESDKFRENQIYWEGVAYDAYEAKYKALMAFMQKE